MKKIRFDLLAILLINFSGSFGFGLVIPFLVILVTRYGGNAFIYGVIGSIYPLCQSLASPLLGKLSDTYGRKPILAISQLGTLIGWIVFLVALFLPLQLYGRMNMNIIGMFALTLPLITIAIARGIDGLTGGNISIAQAYIADIATEKQRSADYGKLSVASNIGFVVGPALAGILSVTFLGEKLPVIAAIIISLITLLFILIYLPESHTKAVREKQTQQQVSLFTILKFSDVRLMLFLYFILYVGFNFFYVAFPVFATQQLLWSVTKMGMYFSALSIMMVIAQGPVLSYATKRFNDGILAIAGTIILGINFLLLISGNDILIYLAAVFFAFGNGIMWPSILSLLAKVGGKQYQGAVQGWAGSASGVASIIGLVTGGILFTFMHGSIFILSAAFIFSVLLFSQPLMQIAKKGK